ncbi:hypothetical protein QR680_008502 [Steinernema hermaphroditum]|uniref:Serpentine receptor class gamma n=1 Tax=Steinernema hermaphroditum TaxID=289476 RepID=A0AA39IGU0_9BILA|nr:hypothetical protein QR680_008502 [Steinernema hermaphroditum]
MNSEAIMVAVSLLYGIPSFALYIVILFQLVRPKNRKRFGNPFFGLCFLLGVVDCFGYLDFYIFMTLPTYSFFSSFYGSSLFYPSAFTTAIYFSTYLFTYLQLFGNCFLTFNRFTCIVFPLKHNRIWRYCLPISIAVTVLSALIPCWYLATTSTRYVPLFDDFPDQGYAMDADKTTYPSFSNSFNLALSNFVACGLCLVMSIVSSSFLIVRTSKTAAKNRKAELNLFFLALLIFFLQSVFGIHQVLIYIAIKIQSDGMLTLLYTLLPWLSDLKFLSPPWVLFFVSTAIRETVLQGLPQRLYSYKKWTIGGRSVTATGVSVRSVNPR